MSTEDEMIGHKSEQAPGVGEWQGSLARCSPWDRKESDMTEQLNWTEMNDIKIYQVWNRRCITNKLTLKHTILGTSLVV